jgi:hypothetical protein
MVFPMTMMPGQQGQGAPMSALMAMSGRVPMFSAHNGPRYTGPFNAGGQYGSLLEMAMPVVMQSLTGSQNMPAQFFPEQNFYDQMEATRHFEAGQQAMAMASRRDTRAMEKMLGGMTQLMTKKPLTEMQTARNHRIAGGIAQYMPMLTQVLGPDMIDQLHGSRGSATVFAQQFHQAMRTGIDPIAHTAGYSGASAGRATQEVFEKLFGDGADLGRMKGMSAGQAGILLNELQSRGMLGKPMGLLPINEQRSLLPQTLAPDVINRLAEQLPSVQNILKRGDKPTEQVLAAARQQIQDSHGKLRDPTLKMDQRDLEQLPGGQDIIRAGDAERIAQKLSNLSGAVKAMRDIFGDMGNPNAPMREIMNGLEALTQGGLATMSPGQVEMMVRKTHTLAQQTGVGVEGMLALTSQNAELADRLGLNRTFAVTSAQQAAAFGAAAGDRLHLDRPVWGALTKEQLTLADQQLRMHAASSPLANQMNALMRMSDTGMINPADGTELAAMTEAIRRGDTQYTFGGRKNDIATPHANLLRMLKNDGGMNETQAYAILQDIQGNQEFGLRHNTTDTIRRSQSDETVRRMLMPVLGGRLRGMLADEGVDQLLKAQGIVSNDKEFSEMMNRMGRGVGTDFLAIDPADVRDPGKQRQLLGKSVRDRLSAEVRAKMPNATDAEIDTIVNGMVSQMGGEAGLEKMGAAMYATINQTAGYHPAYKSAPGLHNMLNQETLRQANSRDRQAEVAAMTQSALAGLGTAGPVQRLADVLQNAGPGTTLQDVLGGALGGVSIDAIKAADPNGGLAKVFDLLQENKTLDPTDPRQLEQTRRNAAVIQGLVEGGDVAGEQLRLLDASRQRIGEDAAGTATAAQQAKALSQQAELDQRDRRLRDAKLTNQQQEINATRERLRAIADGSAPEGSDRIVGSTTRAMAGRLGSEEVALGGNRFLTSRGIITKGPDGKVVNVSGFDDMATVQTAMDVFQQRQDQATGAAQNADQTSAAETQQQKLRRAARGGLLLGDLTTGNERLYEQLLAALQRGSDTSLLGPLGYQLGADVSIDQVRAIVDSGKLVSGMLGDGKTGKDERASAISTFINGSRSRALQLLGDERSMRIIGQGGLELVNSVIGHSDKLQAMAAEQSKKLGKTITEDDLLMGANGVDKNVTAAANAIVGQMQTQWGEIDRNRSYGMLPGEGDPANKARKGMSEQELKDLRDQQQFIAQNPTVDTRSTEAFNKLLAIATPEQRARMRVDVNRDALMKALSEGDRGVSVHQSLHSRQELMEMGLKKGIFNGKTRLDELTDADELGAAAKLAGLDLSDVERKDFDRLRRQAALFMDFGTSGTGADEVTQDTLRRVKQSAASQALPPPEAKDRDIKVTTTGTVTIRRDGKADLALEGRGLMDHVANTLGMV